ncbi:MAG: V-type ATPase subunit [Treponema sp.]|nr:V-type ATPase subunit [Treponema sp.]
MTPDFAYAKACGIIGKSFIGKRIAALEKMSSLQELDRLVFPAAVRELPVKELLANLEQRILQRTVRHIRVILNSYSIPPQALVLQLRSCEYAGLKTCLHHIAAGKKTAPPAFNDIGRFSTVRFSKYPNLAAMLAGTEFAFILTQFPKDPKPADLTAIEAALDRQYYTLLTESICGLPAADRLYAQRILAEEISLRNCVWALRLRTYFKKDQDETARYLMDLKMFGQNQHDEAVSLAAEARKSLRFPLDSRPAWNGWRWEKLLNPQKAGEQWTVDPRYFQNAASRYIYRLSRRCFRFMPFSVSSIFCYIKLKHYEEDLLISIAEGLALGMSGKDVFAMLEVTS